MEAVRYWDVHVVAYLSELWRCARGHWGPPMHLRERRQYTPNFSNEERIMDSVGHTRVRCLLARLLRSVVIFVTAVATNCIIKSLGWVVRAASSFFFEVASFIEIARVRLRMPVVVFICCRFVWLLCDC